MKRFLISVAGTIVGIMLLFFLMIAFGVGISSRIAKQGEIKVKPNSVIYASFASPIGERGLDNPLSELDLPAGIGGTSKLGLDGVLRAIEKAKTDDNIKGFYLDIRGIASGWVQTEDIRNKLMELKESGKFVIAYSDLMSQKSYYLASAAGEVYLNPSGTVELKGFSSKIAFVKNMLKKLEIEPQIFYVGNYKSATEPLRYTEMSDANREQVKAYLEDFYDVFLENIATARNIPKAELHDVIDNLKIQQASDAKQYKVVDDVKYESEVLDIMRDKIGLDKDEKISFISLKKYVATAKNTEYSKNKIAVVYAEGGIVDGKGSDEEIGSDRYASILRKIRRDDKVKAVVLRVNSGGGSALASDVIWNEIEEIKAKGIPVVTSMGDVAASGGYYIASNSDEIFAEENTLTGSIGVFGVLADFDEFYNNKLGITFDKVKTTRYSDFPTSPMLTGDLTSEESNIIQNGVDHIYTQFKERVAAGRGMTMDAVEAVAQGRVWTGKRALEKGLVDKIGNTQDAIESVAQKAELEEYRLVSYPQAKDPLQELMQKLSGGGEEEAVNAILRSRLGSQFRYFEDLDKLLRGNRYQMRLPFHMEIQ